MRFFYIALCTLALSGCASTSDKQTTPAAKKQLVTGSIDKTMDDTDRMKVNRALETLPTNKTSAWTNTESGITYRTTPTKTYFHRAKGASQPCREFTITAIIGGTKQQTYNTACRQSDGIWKPAQ